jgi:hypothetical protein
MKKLPCKMLALFTGHFHHENGKFRAEHFTQSTGYTQVGVENLGRMVTFGIEDSRHLQYVSRAICRA